MNRSEFMAQLESLLSDISENERKDAMKYYNDYFDDAGADKEQDVIESLGTPDQVAKTVKEGLTDAGSENQANNTNAAASPKVKKPFPAWAIVLIIVGGLIAISAVIGITITMKFVKFAKKTGNEAKTVIEEVIPQMESKDYLPNEEIITQNITEAVQEAIGEITGHHYEAGEHGHHGLGNVLDLVPGSEGAGETKNITFEVETLDIKNLDVKFGLGVFTVRQKDADDGVIEVNVTGSDAVKCSINNSEYTTLEIATSQDIKFLNRNNIKYQVELAVPYGFSFEKANFDLGACTAELNDFMADEINIDIGAGELNMNNISSDNMKLDVGAGVAACSGLDIKDMELKVGMGEADIKGNISGHLDAECGMGVADFVIDGSETDHNYNIDCGVGAVEIGSYNIASLAKKDCIDNHASSNYDLTCGMGSMSMKFSK